VTIFTYHAVDPGWTAPLSVPPKTFAEHAAWLRARRIVPLEDATPDSGRDIALTFDDGFTSVYEHAMPLLAGTPFTVFLIGKMLDGSGGRIDWVDRPPPHPLQVLDRGVIREMQQEGVRFGSHSYAHADLTTLTFGACLEDLRRSRDVLEDLLGAAVTSLAYPRGRHDEPVRAAAAEAGFTHGYGLAVPGSVAGPLAIPRVGVYPKDTARSLGVKANRWYGAFRASSPYPWLRRRIEWLRPGAPTR
jgi:peptidoglycan/xylan/chitin deacetylase (PgdA/CDA1 family)